jgi:hypothetical protein
MELAGDPAFCFGYWNGGAFFQEMQCFLPATFDSPPFAGLDRLDFF